MTHSNSKNAHFNAKSKIAMIIMLIAIVSFSCKSKEDEPDETMIEEPMEEEIVMTTTLEKGCYIYNENGSMINFEITKTDNPVEGNLTFALAEKDKNTGAFKGEYKERILFGTYTFQSEGKESKREVAFMLKGNQLIEGYGGLNKIGTKFKEAKKVSYDSKMPLTKTDCAQ